MLLVLLGLTVVSGLLWQWQWSERTVEDHSSASMRVPDYQVEKLRLVSMDAGGVPVYKLQADALVHFPSDKWSDLSEPTIRFTQKKAVSWDASARQGRVYDDSENLELHGDVVLSRPAVAGRSAMQLHTEKLMVRTDQQIAETDSFARLQADTHQLQGKGMQADLKKGKIRFLSKVKGVHRETR